MSSLHLRVRPARGRVAAVAAATVIAAVTALAGSLAAAPGAAAGPAPAAAPLQARFVAACPPATPTRVTCFARYRAVVPVGSATSHGAAGSGRANDLPRLPRLTPADIAAAYRLPADRPGAATVAVVDAQDDPRAEHDLAAYRKRFGLPPCTTANGCFRKVNEHGRSAPLPAPDPGWGVEISLDLDAVSAACPGCRILLVEGADPGLRSLGLAENTAVRLGADVVSNSYGIPEFYGVRSLGLRYYHHPGVSIVVSSGDEGFGVPLFPAVLRSSIAVGGTSLQPGRGGHGWVERAWDGASSGCSGYVPKPRWQHDSHCPTRMVADVSAVADPESGFLVNDTFGLGRHDGYIQVGGTSLSAPLIAGMIGRAGNPRALSSARWIYQHHSALHDVRGGSNGYCGGDYLCAGRSGYDGPTGAGSPRGLGAL